MADLFEQDKRVVIACSNCRERKVKCMARPQDQPCMRCEKHGLLCEYMATEKQRARGSRPSNPGTPTTSTTSYPPSSSNQTPAFGGYAQSVSYGGYMPSTPPATGGNPYNNTPNAGSGSQYKPPSHHSNAYPSMPGYQFPAQAHGHAMPQPGGSKQSSMYPGAARPQQPMNPNYPINYGNYTYDYNTSNQPR
ncbi:hypothetical protein DFH08DRAFT_976341 [Mycena albidolilacea]|uniref:Zn(2)-C6 fungal-type domain-containing protein n=1 Tax=Mycena albidolilacea TaxID=1033008 RepID=A0AAD7E9I5_9AGAR|nr:hypothetical protein DFH08DRAFT_976341 [Mycena albidolilacea]